MNPRRTFMKYLGWCPGISAATRFVPDKEIPKSWIIISIAIPLLTIFSVGYYVMNMPLPKEPLIVTVDGLEFSDDVFDDEFNYSMLIDKSVNFYLPLNNSEFAGSLEKENFEFQSLEKCWMLLEKLGTPMVVRGFSRWISNGSYQEAAQKYIKYSKYNYSDIPNEFGKNFGILKYEYIGTSFTIVRRINPFTGYEELYISKDYLSIEAIAPIWTITVRISNSPPYSVVFTKHPLK